MFDFGAESVDCATLMTLGLVLVVFGTAEYLFVEPVENDRKGFAVDGSCTAISVHHRQEVFEGGLLCNLVAFVLQRTA